MASHLWTDYYLSGWPMYLGWPFSNRGYEAANSVQLGSPINTGLVYAIPVVLAVVALVCKRTPLEFISPRLDQFFLAWFMRKRLSCATCGKPGNLACDACGAAVCPRHGILRKGWRLLCPACDPQAKPKPTA